MIASATPSPAPKSSRGSALLLVLTALSLTGCATMTRPPSQVDRLLKHPEFKYAAQAAPHFTTEALQALADAEARAK